MTVTVPSILYTVYRLVCMYFYPPRSRFDSCPFTISFRFDSCPSSSCRQEFKTYSQ